MNVRLAAAPAALNRARRRAGLDRNPMRRRVDHIQSAVGLALAVIFLVGAPWSAIWIGGRVYGQELRAEHTESAQRHMVTARVIDPGKVVVRSGTRILQVSWRDANGRPRTADYPGIAPDTGSMTTIWVDRSDHLVQPPRKHSQTITDGVMAGSGAALVILTVLFSGYALLRSRLDRSRYRLWDTGWASADHRWHGSRGNRPEQG